VGVSCAETLRKVRYGKGDTLGLDAIPELTIASRLKQFDKHSILITEELDDQAHRRWPKDSDSAKQPLMFFCDPTDRSIQLEKFFQRISKKNSIAKVSELMSDCDPKKLWEEMFEAPVTITGPTAAITCVRKGEIIFSVILNYITSIIYVATDIGVYWYELENLSGAQKEKVTLVEIFKNGKKLCFPGIDELDYSLDDCKQFVTFLGKTGYPLSLRTSK